MTLQSCQAFFFLNLSLLNSVAKTSSQTGTFGFVSHDDVRNTFMYNAIVASVIRRKSTIFQLGLNGKQDWISVDRPKTATILTRTDKNGLILSSAPKPLPRDRISSTTSPANVIQPDYQPMLYSATQLHPPAQTSIFLPPISEEVNQPPRALRASPPPLPQNPQCPTDTP